jgi:hypothetical protein
MRVLGNRHGQLLDTVTAGLAVGAARIIDNAPGTYQPLHVDRLGQRLFALAHYSQIGGDLVSDPDGVFVRTDAGWIPVSLQLCTGYYKRAVTLDDREQPIDFRPRALHELLGFSAMWLGNIADQQGGPRTIINHPLHNKE